MRWMTWFVAVAFVGFTKARSAVDAQAAPSPPTSELLDQLVGHWRMVGQVRGHPVTYDLEARRILDGRFVELHMKDVAHPSQYEALVFIGEDTLPKRVLAHWLDNFGAAYSVPHGQGAISGDTVQFEVRYPVMPFRDTFVFRRMDHTWIFRLEAGDGHGGWKPFAEYAVRPKVVPSR